MERMPICCLFLLLLPLRILINPLTIITTIWWFDAITHAAIHQTRLDEFLTHFVTQCAYSKTITPIGTRLLG